MPCYKPLKAYKTFTGALSFNTPKGSDYNPLEIPCGQCRWCRLEKSRQWAIRCVHEASLHDRNAFITLTFDDEHLFKRQNPFSLDKTEFPKFMKRLRKNSGATMKYYHCGEYGEKYGRPHYHALLFGYDFPDKKVHKLSKHGHRLYTSEFLEKNWSYGHCYIGDVTYESAAYTARYCMKKVTGDLAEDHYRFVDTETGEEYQREPEYATMSRRPAIAADWFEKYSGDVYPKDFITVNGKKIKPPKFYDRLFSDCKPLDFEAIQGQRALNAAKHYDNNTEERLSVREKIHEIKSDKLKRSLEV